MHGVAHNLSQPANRRLACAKIPDGETIALLTTQSDGSTESFDRTRSKLQRCVLRYETPALRVRASATKLRVPTPHSVDRAVVELVATRDDA